MQNTERRQDAGEIRERLTALETRAGDIPLIRAQVDGMATTLAVLADAAKRADTAHGQMLGEIRALRTDFADAMRQHDQRDDNRFDAVGARLATIEKKLGAADAEAESERRHVQHNHDRRNAIHAALIGLIAACAASVVLVGLTWMTGAK